MQSGLENFFKNASRYFYIGITNKVCHKYRNTLKKPRVKSILITLSGNMPFTKSDYIFAFHIVIVERSRKIQLPASQGGVYTRQCFHATTFGIHTLDIELRKCALVYAWVRQMMIFITSFARKRSIFYFDV